MRSCVSMGCTSNLSPEIGESSVTQVNALAVIPKPEVFEAVFALFAVKQLTVLSYLCSAHLGSIPGW